MSDLFDDIKISSNLITGHINPDGDALGSALAFKLILDSKGVDSDVIFEIEGDVPSNAAGVCLQPHVQYTLVYQLYLKSKVCRQDR